MIGFKIYWTYLFIVMGLWGASALLAMNEKRVKDTWYKSFKVLSVTLVLSIMIGALVHIWTD